MLNSARWALPSRMITGTGPIICSYALINELPKNDHMSKIWTVVLAFLLVRESYSGRYLDIRKYFPLAKVMAYRSPFAFFSLTQPSRCNRPSDTGLSEWIIMFES